MRAAGTSKELPGDLARGRERFESWRRTRASRRTRIPDGLWLEAVRLAGRHGVSRTARTLRLNDQALRRRSAEVARPSDEEQRGDRFVEVRPLVLDPPAAYVVELAMVGGARLRIEVAGQESLDVESLVRSFAQG